MSPHVAAAAAWAFVLFLLIRDWRGGPRSMRGLWIVTLWCLILGSRPPSYWFGPSAGAVTVEAYEEGSQLNQIVYLTLIAAGNVVLWTRRTDWTGIIRRNRLLFAYFGYCVLSACWA